MDFFDPRTPAGRLRRRVAIGAALAVVSAATLGSAAAGLWAHALTPPGPVSRYYDLHWPPRRP